MPVPLGLEDLIDYTDWEREKWHVRLRQQGNEVLKTGVGPHGDGRFTTIGELARHIFSAEKRYVERLLNRPLTDTGTVPADELESLFEFGDESRRELKDFVEKISGRGVGCPAGVQADEFCSESNSKEDHRSCSAA